LGANNETEFHITLCCACSFESTADDELHQLGLDHLDVIGTRLVDEHHDIHDYPETSDSSDKGHIHGSSDDSDDKDYHNPIYDHVNVHKDDYSNFGDRELIGPLSMLHSRSAERRNLYARFLTIWYIVRPRVPLRLDAWRHPPLAARDLIALDKGTRS
jgi:hypothetical protein